DQQKSQLADNKEFHQFIEDNSEWLKPYAAFSHLRDLYNTPDFSQWKLYQTVSWEDILEICDESDEHYQHVEIHYFIQYHAHLQLLAATEYARQNGLILKGDLPIGVYRYSCDAWINPHLYNMIGQAGAPPDAFAVTGQNWGFPTYNWEEMAKDGYQWWKKRFEKLATYFDALRIDHILGFFRIWEIPYEQIEGLLGVFRPALPITVKELHEKGIYLEYNRLVKPYIRAHFLGEIFAEKTNWVKDNLLDDWGNGVYSLKFQVNTQREAEAFLKKAVANDEERAFIQKGIFQLINEVLFIDSQGGFHPRISIQSSRSFQELDTDTRQKVENLYYDYFYYRHNEFWQAQAMKKLPNLVNATNMLICGEDLGMIPATVPAVMKELNILSLEIQRMPKGDGEFGHPDNAPMLSVVSPSSHDMSTIRGWWEEDAAGTQRFFNQILHNQGYAPFFCEPWICKQIIEQHLYSPAMWAVFPLQDLLALDANLRRSNPKEEQINVPANPKHYWQYRLHLNLEELLEAGELNGSLKDLVSAAGR
ncbi:MAG: 4-alpha-glucanotransferase, partial [Bacteroidia bacterium]